MQEVGQLALTVRACQPSRGQIELVQSLAQHGQHTLRLPNGTQLAQLRTARIKGIVIAGKPSQFVETQPNGAGCQCGAHQAHVLRCGDSPQPMHQIMGHNTVKYRVFV